jgi:hypothetical protein
MYIGDKKFGALRANLITNWHACKYDSLLTLQNDAAKNSLWHSATVNIPRNSNSATTQTRGRHLCQCHRTNVLAAVLVKAIIAVITILEVNEVKVLLAVN